MRMIERLTPAAALLAAPLLGFVASCTVITNPGQYEFSTGGCPQGSDASDLQVELFNFEDYENQRIEVRLIRDAEELVLRAVLDGIDPTGTEEGNADTSANLCLTFSDAIEAPGRYEVHTFVDCTEGERVPCGDGDYQPPAEPGWLSGVLDGYAEVDGTVAPTGFDDPPAFPPGNFELGLTGMGVHLVGTQHFALNVLDPAGNIVGFARLPKVADADFTILIRGVLQPNTDYTVEMYADFVRNGLYDPIVDGGLGDHSWVRSYRSDGEGMLVESFAHVGTFEPLDSFTF